MQQQQLRKERQKQRKQKQQQRNERQKQRKQKQNQQREQAENLQAIFSGLTELSQADIFDKRRFDILTQVMPSERFILRKVKAGFRKMRQYICISPQIALPIAIAMSIFGLIAVCAYKRQKILQIIKPLLENSIAILKNAFQVTYQLASNKANLIKDAYNNSQFVQTLLPQVNDVITKLKDMDGLTIKLLFIAFCQKVQCFSQNLIEAVWQKLSLKSDKLEILHIIYLFL